MVSCLATHTYMYQHPISLPVGQLFPLQPFRRYGGIQLGPDRFKHINNVARILLQESSIGRKGEEVLAL